MSATRCLTVLAFALVAAGPGLAQAPDDALTALRAAHDPMRQIALIDQLSRTAPLSAEATAALVAVVQDTGADWSVRGEAMEVLRRTDAPDEAVAQAVAAASAATGEHAGYLRGQAVALQTWKDARANRRGAPAEDPADAERRARLLLKTRNVDVSFDSLTRAVSEGQSGTVSVLMTAGLKVGGDDSARATMAVVSGLATACDKDPVPSAGVAQSLSVLAEHGMPVDLPDESGNTLLMSAAQFCPAPVATRLLELGARPAPVNKQRWTPLQMALVGGKWDVATVLVDAGARLSRTEIDQIFFQPPEAPAQRDLLARATKSE